jgi:two-component system, sensor histidine kinase
MRLRTLLTVTFAMIALALAFASSWTLRAIVNERMRERTGDQLAGIATQIREGLDRGMFERLRDIKVAASLEAMSDPTTTIDAKRLILKRLQETYPAYAILTYISPAGKILATSNGMIEGADVSKREYFIEGSKRPFALDVHDAILLAKLLGEPGKDPPRFVDLAAPVRGADGALVAVLAAHLDWAWADELQQALIEPLRKRMDGLEVLILSEDGTVLLGPPALLKQKLTGQKSAARAVARLTGYQIERWPDGESRITGFSPSRGFKDFEGLGWSVLVRQPTAIAFAPAERLGWEILAAGAASALIFAVLAFFAAALVERPLLALAKAADRLRDGDETSAIPEQRAFREVQTLASSLKALVERLDQRRIAEADAERERAYAETANQAKSEFLASMSHEIRTPLNGILGFTSLMLERSDLPDDVRRRLLLVRTAGQSLLTVVNDILDYSKIEAGEMTLQTDVFRLDTLIGNAVALVRHHAEDKGLALENHVEPGLPDFVVGDEGRLRQVLLNLLNNAIKFTHEGAVSFRLDGVARSTDSVTLRFAVSDTGIGIAPDKRDRLFQRFSQVHAGVQREYGGTGLGLAISKRFVEMMGGAIGVDSELGRGSCFWFTVALPIGAGEPGEEAFAEAFASSERPGRILLADDVPMNQEIVEGILAPAGHRVDIVGNGQEAVRAVESGTYDLVLMDVQMPVMDGVTATRIIRAMPGRGRLPIIALTANVLPDQVAAFRAAGMDDHIGKPFNRLNLLEAVERWLGRSQARARAEAPPAAPAFDAAIHAELVELSGEAAVGRWLGNLKGALLDGPLSDGFLQAHPADQRARAHRLISEAGMLGFIALSQACAAFEAALLEHGEPASAIAALVEETEKALRTIDEIAPRAPAKAARYAA